jgi:hypothetical protein
MQDSVYELRRILRPRTRVNKRAGGSHWKPPPSPSRRLALALLLDGLYAPALVRRAEHPVTAFLALLFRGGNAPYHREGLRDRAAGGTASGVRKGPALRRYHYYVSHKGGFCFQAGDGTETVT